MPFFTLLWLRRAVLLTCLLASMLLAGFRAQAQPIARPAIARADDQASDTAYKGPRFPGGPDSLRALLARTLRHAGPALTGQLFLRLTLDENGAVSSARYLLSPDRATATMARTPAAKKLADELTNKLSVWQLPAQKETYRSMSTSITLPLTFGVAAGAMPLLYSDESPLFPLPDAAGTSKRQAVPNLLAFLMRQVRYPIEDLRSRREGIVYAYFEVSETGAVEQRRIVGSVSSTIDAEVLRALQNLPDAQTPPRQQGRPVRVAYLLPANFTIQTQY